MEETIWQRFDKVISHLVREGQINLAVDAGRARDEALQLMEENPKTSLNEKSTVPLEAPRKVCKFWVEGICTNCMDEKDYSPCTVIPQSSCEIYKK